MLNDTGYSKCLDTGLVLDLCFAVVNQGENFKKASSALKLKTFFAVSEIKKETMFLELDCSSVIVHSYQFWSGCERLWAICASSRSKDAAG